MTDKDVITPSSYSQPQEGVPLYACVEYDHDSSSTIEICARQMMVEQQVPLAEGPVLFKL